MLPVVPESELAAVLAAVLAAGHTALVDPNRLEPQQPHSALLLDLCLTLCGKTPT